MAGEIIKVYNSYSNAVAGGTTGQITVGTVASNGATVYNGNETVPYFIFKEYWYRIETNDLVAGVYIDWDDGEDNSPEKANLEFVEPDKSGIIVITSHIYTKHGSFWPLIKAESIDGYHSKWYTNDANPDYSALEDLTYPTGSATAAAGNQSSSIVREEKAASDKIPHFVPANRQPIGILKSDRKRVYSGIDNDLISGTSPLLYAYTESTASSKPTVTFEAANVESKQIREYANIALQTPATGSNPVAGISINTETVPKGNTYTPAIREKWRFTIAADTVDNSIGANNGLSSPDSNAPYIGLYNSSDTSAPFRVYYTHPAVAQVYSIEMTSSNMADYAGNYIALDYPSPPAGEAPVYYWIDHSGSATEPGALSLVYAKKKVDISSGTTAAEYATILAAAINDGFSFTNASMSSSNVDAFTAPNSGAATFTATCDTAGETASPGIASTGGRISVSITTYGENAGVAPSGSFTGITAAGTSGDSAATITTALTSAINTQGTFLATAVDADTIDIERVTAGTTQDFIESGSGYTSDGKQAEGTPAQGEVANIHKLYKVKLDDIDALTDTDRVFILAHDFDATTGSATPTPDTDECIAVLSNGNPIVELDDPYTVATLDASESYARASNLEIDTYSYDFDKRLVATLHNTQSSIAASTTSVSGDSGTQTTLTETMGYDKTNAATALNYGNLSRIPMRYTHDTLGNPLDSNSRFYNMYRLVRLQVRDNSISNLEDGTETSSGGGKFIGAECGDLERFSQVTDWMGLAGAYSGETVFLTLGTAGSFTKGATITQASSGATGKVLNSTKNNLFVELYDVTGTFNTSNTITSSNSIDLDTSITPSATTVGGHRFLKEDNEQHRNRLMIATGSGRTTHANNKTDSTANVNEGGTFAITDTGLTVTDGTQFTVGDYISIGTATEIMKVTNIATHLLTVTRGEFSTTSVAHADSQDVHKIDAKYVSAATTFDTANTVILGGDSTYELATSTNVTDHPENFIISVTPHTYDKLYFRFDNTLTNSATEPDVNLIAYYTKKTVASNVATYSWEPLPIIDNTQQFRQSGIISWDIPTDWARVIDDDLTWDVMSNTGGSAPASTSWTKDGYGLMIALTVKTPTSDTDAHEQIKLYNIWPVYDDHVELLTVEDPHHVSLNSIAIAQSLSYNRQGKYMVVEDRLGKADIRRIGAAGGQIRFGGVDLGTDASGRNLIKSYQQNGTPVFLDITHKDNSKTRFFGKILRMSEDNPTGKMLQKYAVQMQVAYCIEMNSSGAMTSDKISLGGIIDDVPKYIL